MLATMRMSLSAAVSGLTAGRSLFTMFGTRKTYRWRGKIVTEKVYKRRLLSQALGQLRKKTKDEPPAAPSSTQQQNDDRNQENVQPKTLKSDISERPYFEGRRIVEFSVLAKNMWCASCKEALSFENIEDEERHGLGSILSVRCHKCLLVNQVPTGKQHQSADGRGSRWARFDVNSKAAIGVVQAGMGCTHLNKILASMNIPTVSYHTFQRYHSETGRAMESVAKQSCQDPAATEHELTLKNLEEMQEVL